MRDAFSQVADGKVSGHPVDHVYDHRSLGALAGGYQCHSLGKLPIGPQQHDSQEIFPPGPELVLTLMPALGGKVQGLVVTFSLTLDHSFQTDIAAYFIARPVKQKKGEKTGHATVAVRKRVNAEKIENVSGDKQERIDFTLLPELIEPLVQPVHGLRGQMGRNRRKADIPGTISGDFDDFIVRRLPASPFLRQELIKIPV